MLKIIEQQSWMALDDNGMSPHTGSMHHKKVDPVALNVDFEVREAKILYELDMSSMDDNMNLG
jgi:hypothetical protein